MYLFLLTRASHWFEAFTILCLLNALGYFETSCAADSLGIGRSAGWQQARVEFVEYIYLVVGAHVFLIEIKVCRAVAVAVHSMQHPHPPLRQQTTQSPTWVAAVPFTLGEKSSLISPRTSAMSAATSCCTVLRRRGCEAPPAL